VIAICTERVSSSLTSVDSERYDADGAVLSDGARPGTTTWQRTNFVEIAKRPNSVCPHDKDPESLTT
jgi:hypothetical protein